MPNDAAGTSWDITLPTLSDNRRDGQQEIRGLRAGTAIRMDKEHRDLNGAASPADGGEHVEGSAVAYHQDAPAPVNRPDGTALDAQDDGRLWVDSTGTTETLNVYDGGTTAFVAVTGVQIATGNFTGAALNGGQQTAAAGFATDLFVLLVAFGADTSHFNYIIPLKDDAIIARVMGSSTGSDFEIDVERSGDDVLITRNAASSLMADGTCQWMAFNFG